MPLLHDQFVFWHFPKAGGTFCVEMLNAADVVLEDVLPHHDTPLDNASGLYDHRLPQCFVLRDKLTWLRSAYLHLRDHLKLWPDDSVALQWQRMSVVTPYCRNMCPEHLTSFPRWFETQHECYDRMLRKFLQPGVQVIPFEHMRIGWVRFLEAAGVTYDREVVLTHPPKNVTRDSGRYFEEVEFDCLL